MFLICAQLEFSFMFFPRKDSFYISEPVVILVRIENKSSTPVTVYYLDFKTGLKIMNEKGEIARRELYLNYLATSKVFLPDSVYFSPQGLLVYRWHSIIPGDSFPPGRYRLFFSMRVVDERGIPTGEIISSDTHTIWIIPPEGRMREAMKLWNECERVIEDVKRDPDEQRRIRKEILRKLIREYHDTPYGLHAHYRYLLSLYCTSHISIVDSLRFLCQRYPRSFLLPMVMNSYFDDATILYFKQKVPEIAEYAEYIVKKRKKAREARKKLLEREDIRRRLEELEKARKELYERYRDKEDLR